jgi:hypothetical protein
MVTFPTDPTTPDLRKGGLSVRSKGGGGGNSTPGTTTSPILMEMEITGKKEYKGIFPEKENTVEKNRAVWSYVIYRFSNVFYPALT